jgi:hypothetical protein
MADEIKVPAHIMEFQRERYIESMREKIELRPGIYAEACALFPFQTQLGGKETVDSMKKELGEVMHAAMKKLTDIDTARRMVKTKLEDSYKPKYGGGRKRVIITPAPTEFPTDEQVGIGLELLTLFPFKTLIRARDDTVPARLGELDEAEAGLKAGLAELKGAFDAVNRLLDTFAETRFGGRRALSAKKTIAKKAK